MSSPLPPSPGAAPTGWAEQLGALADRLGTSVAALVGGALLAVVVAAALVLTLTRDEPPPPELAIPYASPAGGGAGAGSSTTSSAVPAEVTAHAAGAVARPGVYLLAADARVGDLLAAAGGPLDGADLDRLNLAAPITDGSRIYVPRTDEPAVPVVIGPDVSAAVGPGGGSAAPSGPLDLNQADAAALEELPGIGPATASAIVAHREEHGPFSSVDGLLDVRGIGEAKLAAIRDLVRV